MGVVQNDQLALLNSHHTVYACATHAIQNHEALASLIVRNMSDVYLDYNAIYTAQSDWQILPAFDHPDEPACCLVTGTGLTHRKSADYRHSMHQHTGTGPTPMTDSMKIYAWGEEGGRPEPGLVGVQPEWFYKGNGTILCAHGDPLILPAYGEDGGEEAEIALAYIVDPHGVPWRVGFMQGNEFSDHRMEARNYLYLAPSKLRVCSIGPELLVGDGSETSMSALFDDVQGSVRIEREGQLLWQQQIASGEANMVHTLANLEHHHFKYALHRRPGDAHVHFVGTGGFSFGSGVALQAGDEMVVEFMNYGRPLRNPLHVDEGSPALATVRTL